MHRSNILLALFVVWAWSAPVAAIGDEELKRRVLEEAPREWKRFRERALNHSKEAVAKRISGGVEKTTGQGTTKSRGAFKLTIGEDLTVEEENPKEPALRVTVLGINDQYYFQLRAARREGPFKLVALQKLAPEDAGQEPPRDMFRSSWLTENDFLIVHVEALPEIFSKPYFQLRSAEYLAEGDKRYVRCEISYDHQRSDRTIPFGKAWIPYKEFMLDLDPDNYFQIRRVTAELTQGDITYVLTEEVNVGAGPPGPLYVFKSKSVNKATGEIVKMEINETLKRSFTTPPKANFYLSAFGLPEPPGFQKPGVPIFVWFGGAGLILVVAGLFWHRYRKTAR
ncbi:MAG: hypothetical protein ACR2FY_21430 [Pirellulaceae bacterium]